MRTQDLKELENSAQLGDIVNNKLNFTEFYFDKYGIWDSGALALGTITRLINIPKHYGRIAVSSSTSANSGWRWYLGLGSSTDIFGGEKTTLIFTTGTPGIAATSNLVFGWTKTADHAAPTDQVAARITGTALVGFTSAASANATTSSSYTLLAATTYRLLISINNNRTLVTFTLFADDSTVVLWQDTLNTNIPTAHLYHGLFAYSTDTSAVNLYNFDYMDLFTGNSRRVV